MRNRTLPTISVLKHSRRKTMIQTDNIMRKVKYSSKNHHHARHTIYQDEKDNEAKKR